VQCDFYQKMWSQEQAQLLIDLYKTHPCLYAVKHKDYKNRQARNNALSAIPKELAQVRPGTSLNEIKNKFNNIRTNFMAQYRKYCSSFRSGMGKD
jgi:RNA polymerase-interacting CarD/CdnL/TRCF family regulator